MPLKEELSAQERSSRSPLSLRPRREEPFLFLARHRRERLVQPVEFGRRLFQPRDPRPGQQLSVPAPASFQDPAGSGYPKSFRLSALLLHRGSGTSQRQHFESAQRLVFQLRVRWRRIPLETPILRAKLAAPYLRRACTWLAFLNQQTALRES